MPNSSRARLLAFLAVLVGAIAVATTAILRGRDAPNVVDALTPASDALPPAPFVMFRALDGNRADAFGKVGYATLADGAGPVQGAPLECDRIHFAGGRGICLKRTAALKYVARIVDERLTAVHELPLTGLPSRTRVSADGRYGAVTAFTRGHNYARPGQFSTATTLVEMATGRSLGNLEEFAVTRDDRAFRSVDFNFWGVTFFPDSSRFVATLATRGRTYLVSGDVTARTMRVEHENVECPSLSPDGTRVGYKKRVGGPGVWRFHVLDLATRRETALAETRSIDDQLEWRDDTTVLFGFAEDIFTMPADGSGAPQLFLDGADSPAVIRS